MIVYQPIYSSFLWTPTRIVIQFSLKQMFNTYYLIGYLVRKIKNKIYFNCKSVIVDIRFSCNINLDSDDSVEQ